LAIQQEHGVAISIHPCENKRITTRYTEKQNKRLHVIFKTAAVLKTHEAHVGHDEMKKEAEPKLPDSLWGHVPRMFDNSVWDLKLSDGSVYLDIYVSDDGTIQGRVVGGQDGIVPPPDEITGDNVVAIRRPAKLLGISLARWMKAGDVQQHFARYRR
jgi:hypothetical protein